MKIQLFLGLLFVTCIGYCQTITYDFSCMETEEVSELINWGADFEKELLGTFGETVTINEEIELGDVVLRQLKKEYKIIESGEKVDFLNRILKSLTSQLIDSKGFLYKIYLLQSDELNAFTCGGKIFFTSGMFDFCKNNSEVAAIIGHEIAHNELGHINENISRFKTAEKYGDLGILSATVVQVLTTPFNQKNETHCDFYGIDLMISYGYKPCSAVSLWKRMSELDPDYDAYSNFLSTHPYSGKRTVCCRNHISTNYSNNCGD